MAIICRLYIVDAGVVLYLASLQYRCLRAAIALSRPSPPTHLWDGTGQLSKPVTIPPLISPMENTRHFLRFLSVTFI